MARVDLGWKGFQRLTEIEEHLRSAFPAPDVAVKELIVSNVYATNRFAEGARENALRDETVPESFGKLLAERFPNLERLHLGGYWDTPTRFWRLRNLDGLRPLAGQLRVLQVMLNKLEDLSVLADFRALCRLDLSFNPLTDKALEALRDLPHLEHLTLLGDSNARTKDNDGNKIYEPFSALTSLDGLGALPALKRLYATGNCIAQLPADLADWSALEELHLGYNQLSGALDLPALERLRVLDLRHNGITELHTVSENAKLPRLEELYLTSNQLQTLPSRLLELAPRLEKLYFSHNPLEGTFEPYANEDRNLIAEVKAILEALAREGDEIFHEAKVVFLGNGYVGKTSIRKRLVDPDAEIPQRDLTNKGNDPEETQLDVVSWTPKGGILNTEGKEISFTFHLWDFGGQGKYRAVQQFFCSPYTLYVYVTSPDEEKNNEGEPYLGFDFWLPFIKENEISFGGTPSTNRSDLPPTSSPKKTRLPLLCILNKKDLLQASQAEADFFPSQPALLGTLPISTEPPEDFDLVERAIKKFPVTILRAKSE